MVIHSMGDPRNNGEVRSAAITRRFSTLTVAARRFHTQFYITFLQSAPSSRFASGGKQERLPTPDGGQEVIVARFVHPQAALAEARANTIRLMPPQVYLLSTIADVLTGHENTAAQRECIRALAEGAFGRMIVQPQPAPQKDEQGRTIFLYEGDEARGGAKGRLHRTLAKFHKSGVREIFPGDACLVLRCCFQVATDVVLQRNFDVFTELENVLLSTSSKL